MLMLVSWGFPIRLVPVQPSQEVRYGPTQRWPSYDLPRVPAAAARPVDGMSYCESVSRLRAGLAGPQASPSCSPATIGHRGVLGNRPPPQQDDARLSDWAGLRPCPAESSRVSVASPGTGWRGSSPVGMERGRHNKAAAGPASSPSRPFICPPRPGPAGAAQRMARPDAEPAPLEASVPPSAWQVGNA